MHDSPAPVRVAIVGVNNQGLDHLDAIKGSSAVVLSALCDLSRDAIDRTVRERNLGDVHRDTDLAVTAGRDDVDALIIALPHDAHKWAVGLAVQHRKHLLKEKPIARTLVEAHEMVRKVRAAGLVMHTGVQRRHHATYRFLKEKVHGTSIQAASVVMTIASKSAASKPAATQPDASSAWRDDFGRAGGGVLIDLGYHGIDLMHYLLGPMQPISCVMLRDGAPCLLDTVDDDARVWAAAGPTLIHMRFGRSDTRTEAIVLDTADGRYTANREHVHFTPPGGESTCIFSAERAWTATMVEQFQTFAHAIHAGAVGTNDLAGQIPTMRFIEQCYAMRREQGFADPEAP